MFYTIMQWLALGSLLEEFSDYEQSLGKSLAKTYERDKTLLANVILVSGIKA